MSFRVVPANIISRMQALSRGQLNPFGEGADPERPPTPHAGKHNDDGHFDPSPIDVAVVRIMLAKATKLPVDIVDGIFELAEYWVHTTTVANYESSPLSVSTRSTQDKFLLRSLPIGFTSEHGGNLDLTGEPASPKHLNSQPSDKMLARMADYPLPKLQSPVRKIVFKATSHDQGWSGESGGLYESSWTWFEAGLERLESSEVGEPHDPPPTSLSRQALRPVYPTIAKNEKYEAKDNSNDNKANAEKAETSSDEPEFQYEFPLIHSPKWTVCRNKRAHRDWQDHTITWTCYDNVNPDSDAGKALEENGRGRESGDGDFVRNLQLGDVVTLWAKARFPRWTNSVKSASIDVYWAAT